MTVSGGLTVVILKASKFVYDHRTTTYAIAHDLYFSVVDTPNFIHLAITPNEFICSILTGRRICLLEFATV